jgi:hypothetical protein
MSRTVEENIFDYRKWMLLVVVVAAGAAADGGGYDNDADRCVVLVQL